MPRWPLSILLILVACSGGDTGEAARSAVENHHATLRALGQPAPAGAPRRDHSPQGPTPGAAVPGRLGEGPAPRQASQLMGAGPDAVLATLGEPSLRRDEGGASVWLYASGGCQLDIVLYPGAGGPRVAHVQARAGGLVQRTEAACLRDIATHASNSDRRRPAPAPELGA